MATWRSTCSAPVIHGLMEYSTLKCSGGHIRYVLDSAAASGAALAARLVAAPVARHIVVIRPPLGVCDRWLQPRRGLAPDAAVKPAPCYWFVADLAVRHAICCAPQRPTSLARSRPKSWSR